MISGLSNTGGLKWTSELEENKLADMDDSTNRYFESVTWELIRFGPAVWYRLDQHAPWATGIVSNAIAQRGRALFVSGTRRTGSEEQREVEFIECGWRSNL